MILGGGFCWWSIQKQTALVDEITALQAQVRTLRSAPTSVSSATADGESADELTETATTPSAIADSKLADELVETKVRLAVMQLWGGRDVFRSTQDKNIFYFVNQVGNDASIEAYDLRRDTSYQQDGSFNVVTSSERVFSQKLDKNMEFRGIGLVGSKFVFTEVDEEFTPSPCTSDWFYPNLEYIDVSASKPTRQAYVLPEDVRTVENNKMSECLKSM